MWYVYILLCDDGSFYTGVTGDLHRRLDEHSSGIGSRYTACHGAALSVYHEVFQDRNDAEARENQIKRWSKAKKVALIEGQTESLKALSVSRDSN